MNRRSFLAALGAVAAAPVAAAPVAALTSAPAAAAPAAGLMFHRDAFAMVFPAVMPLPRHVDILVGYAIPQFAGRLTDQGFTPAEELNAINAMALHSVQVEIEGDFDDPVDLSTTRRHDEETR